MATTRISARCLLLQQRARFPIVRVKPACLRYLSGTGISKQYENQYIDGKWTPSTNSPHTIDVTDSNTGKVVATVPRGSKQDTLKAIAAARTAFEPWAQTSLAERKSHVQKFMQAFEDRRAEVIKCFTQELGCTTKFAEGVQANMVSWHTGTLLSAIDSFEWEYASGNVTVVKEPIGVVGAITPWNYPLNQIALKVVPAILAGCTVVLKPSEVTPMVAYLVAEAVHEAEIPRGVFNMVVGEGAECAEVLAASDDVDLVSFTGSTRAGKILTQVAARTMKPVRTELGGKSAAVLLDDADFEKVVPHFMDQLINNSGQSCNALSRMLVPRSHYERVVAITKQKAESVTVGHAEDPNADIGPLVSQRQWERVQEYLSKGVEEGALLVCGGPGKPEGLDDGYFVKPTVFADVNNQMSIAQEEIFGPVLSLIPYDSEEDAVQIANDTIYGLNNAVASKDAKRALHVASQLRSGMVMVNNTSMDLNAPFGGYKQSGNAREWGIAGLEEFLITKTVNIALNEYRALKD